MEFIEWNDSLKTGIKIIDVQHRHIARLTNRLYDAMIEQNTEDIITTAIKELEEYAQYHFETEEVFMKKCEYAHSAKHILEHQGFAVQIQIFKLQLRTFNQNSIHTLLNFLRNWLINHILGTDRLYIEDFTKAGFNE
jgi:hemerythrin